MKIRDLVNSWNRDLLNSQRRPAVLELLNIKENENGIDEVDCAFDILNALFETHEVSFIALKDAGQLVHIEMMSHSDSIQTLDPYLFLGRANNIILTSQNDNNGDEIIPTYQFYKWGSTFDGVFAWQTLDGQDAPTDIGALTYRPNRAAAISGKGKAWISDSGMAELKKALLKNSTEESYIYSNTNGITGNSAAFTNIWTNGSGVVNEVS